MNRARVYRILSFSGGLSYEFDPSPTRHHSFTPLRLTFNKLQRTTAQFDSVIQFNPSLYLSLQDQFIPAMDYSYKLNNAAVRANKSKTRWHFSLSEAGNIISGIYALSGKKFNETKTIMGNSYSQFVKMTTELSYDHYLNRNQRLVFRVGTGVIYSYGNTLTAPYSEQFYVGGANSIRAFTIRSVGPGRFVPDEHNPYAYIDQIGDIKVEANIEYRFRLVGQLHGAVFLDAGNVWLMREDETRPGGQLEWKYFLKDLATGTGLGFRYDMELLVFRFDFGYALPFPYQTSKSGSFTVHFSKS